MTDCMVDIETLGTSADAAILSIGAVIFGPDGMGAEFHEKVDLEKTAPELRGEIDPSTVEWWLRQSDDARRAVVSGKRLPLPGVLARFERFLVDNDVTRLWSNGPTFDETIIRRAAERCGYEVRVSFRGSRCCRTLNALALSLGWNKNSVGRAGTHHDALDDAKYQALVVISQKEFLREGRAARLPSL